MSPFLQIFDSSWLSIASSWVATALHALLMPLESTRFSKAVTYCCSSASDWKASLVSIQRQSRPCFTRKSGKVSALKWFAYLSATASYALASDFGDGRHGDIVISQSTTVEALYASVRLPSDPPVYQASDPLAVPNFRSVRLTNGARLSTTPWNGASGGWIVCKVQADLVVEPGASISASASGYAGGASYADGSGPGAGGKGYYNHPRPGDTYYRNGGGGGYGTAGGRGTGRDHDDDGWGGVSYGEPTLQPRLMGSGGGGGEPPGGNGGGVVEIHAGSLQLNGTIDANGGAGNLGGDTSGGGGSGGSIFLHLVFGSVANVTALGGNGVSGSGSGGVGRIRLEHCGTVSGTTSPAASISANPLEDGDGDGLTNLSEWGSNPLSPRNSDSDPVPDYLDPDSDGDTIPDAVEKGQSAANPSDSDADTIVDYIDPDSDNDGIPDSVEAGPVGTNPVDSDGDGTPDYRDTDSDTDGVPDAIERGPDGSAPQDSEQDGKPDYRDPDSNNNGIPDSIELMPDGSPHPEDSDADGLPDYWELFAGLNVNDPADAEMRAPGGHFTWLQKYWADLNPLANDTDQDGIEDHLELGIHGSSPLLVDSDRDGMPDGWEIVNQLDPRKDDSQDDHDFDLITNLIEYNGGVDSTKANSGDSDGDGVSDYSERNPDLNPWVALYDRSNRLLGVRHARGSSFAQRYDGNGNLLRQAKLGLDTDGDGLSDLWEFAHGFDPKSATGNNGPAGDIDGDGWSNLQEQAGGSSPLSDSEKPGYNGRRIGTQSVPFSPLRFISATGQLDFGGTEELVVAADGDPGAGVNEIRIYRDTGDFWSTETVAVGAYGVTSIVLGQVSGRPPAIYLGQRKPGGRGRVIELSKTGPAGTWSTLVISESLDETAYVKGISKASGVPALLVEFAPRFGPSGGLYQSDHDGLRWVTRLINAGRSRSGGGLVIRDGDAASQEQVARPLESGGLEVSRRMSHGSFDEFDDVEVNPLIWSQGWNIGIGGDRRIEETSGELRLYARWGTSGSNNNTHAWVETAKLFEGNHRGVLISIPSAGHQRFGSNSVGGTASIQIGGATVFETGSLVSRQNVLVQVIRTGDRILYRWNENGGPWGSWGSAAFSNHMRLEAWGVDPEDGDAHLHLSSIRYKTPAELIAAGPSASDHLSTDGLAAYRAANNTWYFKSPGTLSWKDGQVYSLERGGVLAAIDSPATNSWLQGKFGGEFWLGRYRETSLLPWQWASGSNASFSPEPWASGQPGTGADQVYVFTNGGSWATATGGEAKASVHEINATSVDGPTAVTVPEPLATTRLEWTPQLLAGGRFNPASPPEVSMVNAFIDDKDATGTVTPSDEFVVAEFVLGATPAQVRTLERRPLTTSNPLSYGLAAARTKEGTSDLLMTAENDGKVFAWLPPASGGSLVRNLISVDHIGKAWHGLSRVSIGGGTDGIAGLRVDPSSPQSVDIVFWSPTELGFSAPPVILQSPPSARVAATPASGGAGAPVNVTLWDSEGNPSRIAVQYQSPPGSGPWQDAALLTIAGQPAVTQPMLGAPPTGQTHSITWNALADLGPAFDSSVLLRARATDTSGTGPWSEPMFYSVDLTDDSDGDGIPNDWEFANGLDPQVHDSELDLDKDGLQNLIEFAIGSNPQSPAQTSVPTVFFGNSAGGPAAPGETPYLTMTVTKNAAASALNFSVEISGDLITWQSGPGTLTVLEESATHLKVRSNSAVPAHPSRAMRLKVTAP